MPKRTLQKRALQKRARSKRALQRSSADALTACVLRHWRLTGVRRGEKI